MFKKLLILFIFFITNIFVASIALANEDCSQYENNWSAFQACNQRNEAADAALNATGQAANYTPPGGLLNTGVTPDSNIDLTTKSTPLTEINKQTSAFLGASGISNAPSVGGVISTIITIVLGLLAIIFVALLVYAGFLWMTASGNEEQVKKATGLIKNAIIGLIIILAAYSITYFVFNVLRTGVSGGGVAL